MKYFMSQLDEIVQLLREINAKLSAHHLFSESGQMTKWNIDELMTRMAVVSRLGISERTYNRWVKSGVLKPIYLGNKHYYREEDIQMALKRSVEKGLI